MKTLLTGLGLPESPRWHDGRLWLANWGAGEIISIDPAGESRVEFTVPTWIPFSIDWLPDGRELVVAGQEGRLLRREPDGTLVTHADLTPLGQVFNELVVDARGNAYVNGANLVLVTPDGRATEVAAELAWGNGMAISDDGSTLIVAESHANRLTAFDIAEDGTLSGRRVWADCGDGFPDGICLDAEGAVWYADVPNQRCVRVREGGQVLQTVQADRGCFACMLGDGTLYVLNAVWPGMEEAMKDPGRTGQVQAVEVSVPHAGRP
ncbi:SMP-30/gluconolactonase/LRE family protein [Nonomuraea sp. NPDC050536]|uniref:SMP-30/gluconolactonase/LRE family protein n=1 Tax=Nonomuraea sp. NPDC050536 TaxID=3364366 RepID=UPI0037C6C93A